jgi:hypothetical protein
MKHKYEILKEDGELKLYIINCKYYRSANKSYEERGEFLGSYYGIEDCKIRMIEYDNNPIFRGTLEEFNDGHLV